MQNKSTKQKTFVTPYIVGAISLCLFIGLWEYVGNQPDSAISSVMPPPSKFLIEVVESDFKLGLGSQAVTVQQSVIATFIRVFAGMGIAFVAAIITGALFSLSKYVTWAVSPILYLLAPIAPIAWIPIAIVVFGIGNLTAIFVVFMGVYFILTIATLVEIKRIPQEYITHAKNLGASKIQIWFYVIVPAILPSVFTLLRINFIGAWMAVLVAEMVGLRDGIGAIIMMGRNLFNSELIMFGMLVIGISGFIINKLLLLVQKHFLWWKV